MNNQKHLACDTPDEYPEQDDYFAKWEKGYDHDHPFQRFVRWLSTSSIMLWLRAIFS